MIRIDGTIATRMDTADLIDFYNTLFGIEVAIFGIISAVIFVFVQLVFSTYSYKHIGHIVKDKWLVLFTVFSISDLIMTSVASYFLSLGKHDLIPGLYLYTQVIITNPYYPLICLLSIFISLGFFAKLILNDLSYLQPRRALLLLSQDIAYVQIRDYLWKKFPLSVPYNIRVRFTLFEELKKPKKKAKSSKKQKDLDKEELRITTEITRINSKVKYAEDPFLPFRDMVITSIKKSDLSLLEEACHLIEETTERFLLGLPKFSEEWTAEKPLSSNYIKHLIEIFDTFIEIAEKEGLESAKRSVLRTSYVITGKLFEINLFDEVDKLCEWWQKIADDSIGRSSILFQDIIKYYSDVGARFFKLVKKTSRKEQNQRLLENIFVYIGWLGERLLIKLPFEESPLFSNHSYSTEYDDYYNCLMSFGDLYESDAPQLYPLIYFDALVVVAEKLIKVHKTNPNLRLNENIFSIAYAFASFAEKAIQVKNADGASLAVLRIRQIYEALKIDGFDKDANDVIKLLVRLGMYAAMNKNNLPKAGFMSESLDQWVINELSKSGENIDSEVMESYIKTMEGDHDLRWGFITALGMRMGSNFDLMFDEVTGKTYAQDDPRRR